MLRSLWMVVVFVACDPANPCVDGELSCDSTGLILQDCVDGELVEQENCADSGETCHADMGPAHCGPADMGMDM